MSKLSVIICVYNTNENLFEKCLNSVFNSTIKDLEVIVVNDGSTKDYSSIIKKFDVNYVKTENQGILKARILGVKHCTGEYICFIDSDDFVSFNYLQASLNAIKDADIVLNDWAFNTLSTKYVCGNDSTINSNFVENFPLNKFFASQGKEHAYQVMWNKIFKREVLISACDEIEKLNLKKLNYAEDILICYFAFKVAKKVVNTHLGYYFYSVHANQQVAVHSKEKLENHIESAGLVFNIIENDLKINKNFENYKTNFYAWKQFICSSMYVMAKRFKSKEINNIILQKFKNCKLKKVSRDGDNAYFNHILLPNNIEEIDSVLAKIYYSNKHLKIYAKKNSYAYKSLIKMKEIFNLNFSFSSIKEADIVLPKEAISLKQKILHNSFVCKVGAILFPKGSKIRAFIKRKF